MTEEFRALTEAECESGRQIVVAAARWARDRGVDRVLVPPSPETYRDRQRRGQNYGLFVDGRLAGVVSLLELPHTVWQDWTGAERTIWLGSLATGEAFHGQGVGRRMVNACARLAAARGYRWLYLDCQDANGRLVAYYEALGFQRLTKETRTFSIGTVEAVLMRKDLAGLHET